MIVRIASVLSAEEVAAIRARLEGGAWADGRATAGYQSAQVKDNLQLPHNDRRRARPGTPFCGPSSAVPCS